MTQTNIGCITDVPGVRVGQDTRNGDGWLTGVTVVLPDSGSVGGVDVRGGGPGTHETDALDPCTLVKTVDAIVLTGGSAFGLVSAHGAQRWCAENGRGVRVGILPHEVVPIVPAAAVFDLGRGGNFAHHPTEEMGYTAAAAAAATAPFSPIERGNVGAGAGSALGRVYKGGLGTASIRLPEPNETIVVGAVVVVNAVGLPWLPGSSLEVDSRSVAAPAYSCSPLVPASVGPPQHGLNTTIAVVATNARLDQSEATRTATVAHDGFARALNPVHTLTDGDTIFTVATCRDELAGDGEGRVASLFELHTAAAEATRMAIMDAIASAESVSTPAITLERFPLPEFH